MSRAPYTDLLVPVDKREVRIFNGVFCEVVGGTHLFSRALLGDSGACCVDFCAQEFWAEFEEEERHPEHAQAHDAQEVIKRGDFLESSKTSHDLQKVVY